MPWFVAALALALGAPPEAPREAQAYRFQDELFTEISAAVEASPYPVESELVATSPGGQPVWAWHVAHPAHPVEREVLVFGGIHALEWVSTEVATEVLLDLLEHPVPGVMVTVIPLLNPDGRARVEGDLLAGHNRYRRGNSENVDLNRDFAVNRSARDPWARVLPGYAATSPAPLSQPETRGLDALAARVGYERAVSLHAFGKFLYYPWAGRWERPPDREAFHTLAKAMQQAQGHHYNAKQLSRWGFFFRAHGAEIDHLYGKYGTRAFLIELTRTGIQPWRPKTFHSWFARYNPQNPARHIEAGFRAVRELIRYPALPGEGTGPPQLPKGSRVELE